MRKRILLILLLLLWPLTATAAFDFTLYNGLLQKYVTADSTLEGIPVNQVDYQKWHWEQQAKGSQWRTLLGNLAAFDPATLKTKNEKLAFWGNVYNIAAIKTVLDHWPVDSIRSGRIQWLGQPWKRKAIMIGGDLYSLHQIEFDQLVIGLQDLRGHLAINCASLSCVDLPAEAFDPARIDAQLQTSGERFFSQKEKGLRIDRAKNTVYLSQIFKFDKKNFNKLAGGPIPFLLNYVKDANDLDFLRKGGYDIEYLDYDWSLNGTPEKG